MFGKLAFASLLICLFLPQLSAQADSLKLRGSVSGTVRKAATGDPVSGATVSLILVDRGCPLLEVLTDEQGQFLFHDLESGRYRLDFFKPGYQQTTYGQTPENPVGQEIILSPSKSREDIEVVLPFSASLSGHIYDETGAPVSKCYVFFDPVETTNRSFHKVTDALGTYWAAGLPPGSYRISARRYSPAADQVVGDTWYYPGTVKQEEAEEVLLEEGKTAVIDIYLRKDREPVWSGKIIGPEGEPVVKAEVTFLKIQERNVWYQFGCRTDANGECEMRDLPAGDYWVYPHRVPPPYANWLDRNKQSAQPIATYAKPVHIEPGKKALTEFRLETTSTMEVRFHMMDGTPPPSNPQLEISLGHSFRVQNYTFGFAVESKRNAPESSALYGLLPNLDYQIGISQQDPYKRYCVMQITLNGSSIGNEAVVRLGDTATPVMEVQLERSSTIAGTGKPEYTMAVAQRIDDRGLINKLYRDQFRVLAQKGRFLFRGLPPGTYKIRGEAYSLKNETSTLVTVAPGETKDITLE